MLELGEFSTKQHSDVGKKCKEVELSAVLTIGRETIATDNEFDSSIIHKHFDNKNELISYYNDICEKNDQVLIKGSRGMQMEKIVNSIIE